MAQSYNLGEAKGRVVLETDFSGLDKAGDQLDVTGKQIQGLGKNATNAQPLLKGVGTAGLVAGGIIAGGFALAVKSAGDFEFQMSAIQAVSGATASEMGLINDAALRIGKDTAFSASEAAQAMEELIKAGISTKDVLNGAADATVALAAAGGIDLPQAATISANAMNQFGLSAKDLVGVTDTIAGAANASAIDVAQLGQSMQQVGAVANLTGLSFDDTALAIAAMGNAGIVGSDAGTSLKGVLLNLNPTTKEAANLMEELGIITAEGANQFFDANGKMKSLAEVSDILGTSLAGMSEQQKTATLQTLFGSDAIRGAAIIADTGSEGFNKLSAAIDKTSAADVAKTRMDNMKGSLQELSGSVETAAISIGQRLIPILTDVVKTVTDVANKFLSLPAGVQGGIVAFLGIVGAILLLIGVAAKVTSSMMAIRAGILLATGATALFGQASLASAVAAKIATAGQWLWNAALSANPIGIVIVAILAIVAALIWFFTQTKLGKEIWANFVQFLIEAWTNIASFASTVWNAIVGFVTSAAAGVVAGWGAVVGFFTTIFSAIGSFITGVVNTIIAVWTGVATFFSTIFTAIMAYAQPFIDFFATYMVPLIQAGIGLVVAIFMFLLNSIILTFTTIVGFVSGIVGSIVGFITDGFNGMIGFIAPIFAMFLTIVSTTFANIFKAVSTVVTNVVNFIRTVWGAIIGFVTPIFVGIFTAISNSFNNIKNAVTGGVNAVVSSIRGAWNGIVGFVTPIFNGVYNAIRDPIDRAMALIRGVPGMISGFFGNAGGILVDVGAKIIGGLINGIKSAIGGITSVLQGITSLIPKVKGPEAVDRKLLEPAGELIMMGLMSGIQSKVGNLMGLLGGLNVSIPAAFTQHATAQFIGTSAPATVAPRSTTATINVYGQENPVVWARAVGREFADGMA